MTHEIREITAQATYDLRHRVLWPDHPPDFVKIPTDGKATHFGALDGARIVGVVSLYPVGTDLQLRKLATEAACRGQGIGSALVRHCIQTARSRQVPRIFLSGRLSAHPFYTRLGFAAYGAPYLVEDEPCQKMEMLL